MTSVRLLRVSSGGGQPYWEPASLWGICSWHLQPPAGLFLHPNGVCAPSCKAQEGDWVSIFLTTNVFLNKLHLFNLRPICRSEQVFWGSLLPLCYLSSYIHSLSLLYKPRITSRHSANENMAILQSRSV